LNTVKNSNKNAKCYLSKNHFLSKKGPKQVPLIIFVRLKAIFSKTAVKMASRSIKKPGSKNLLLQVPQKDFTFSNFFLVLPLFRDAPQSPLEFSNFCPAEIQANTQTNNPQKQNCDIFKTQFSTNVSI
jgi:hypothetical protein